MKVTNVTKPIYIRLLSIVGRSERPLSKYEIQETFAKEKKKPKQRQSYRMIKTLAAEDPDVPRSLRFLDITLKERCVKRISQLEKRDGVDYHQIPDMILGNRQTRIYADQNMQATSEIEKMCWQTENRRYVLNFRGFLLILYGEYNSELHDSRDKIRRLILNPKIVSLAPFLKYWQDFEEIELDTFKILMDIVKELGTDYILDPNIDVLYLLLRATEIYYNKVSSYFGPLEMQIVFRDPLHEQLSKKLIESQVYKKVKDYRLTMLRFQKRLLSARIMRIDKLHEMYSQD